MESNLIVKAAAILAAIGSIGGGALVLDSRHAPMSVVAEIGVMEIFDLVELARRDGPSEWICDAIDKKIIEICDRDPDHYLCEDRRAVDDLKNKAGCE